MSKQIGILIQQSDLQLLFTKNVQLHIELCMYMYFRSCVNGPHICLDIYEIGIKSAVFQSKKPSGNWGDKAK